jgi:hypothetical protein
MIEEGTPPRYALYLLLPWVCSALIGVSFASGAAEWAVTRIPFGLGAIAVSGLPFGFLLLWIGCSARLVYEFQRFLGYRGTDLVMGVIGGTILLLFAHICVAAALTMTGSLFVRAIVG